MYTNQDEYNAWIANASNRLEKLYYKDTLKQYQDPIKWLNEFLKDISLDYINDIINCYYKSQLLYGNLLFIYFTIKYINEKDKKKLLNELYNKFSMLKVDQNET